MKYEIVRLKYAINIGAVDADSDTHYHVLWTFSDTVVYFKKIGPFEGFETKAGG